MEDSKIKSCKKNTNKRFTNDYIKKEPIHVNPMSRAKREYMNIFEDIQYTQEEKLRVRFYMYFKQKRISSFLDCKPGTRRRSINSRADQVSYK